MHFPFRLHISAFFATIVLLVGGLIGIISYQEIERILRTNASTLAGQMSRQTTVEIHNLIAPASIAVRQIGYGPVVRASSLQKRLANMSAIREALSAMPAIESIYVGYANGDFFFIRQLQNDHQRSVLSAPPRTKFVIQSIERDTHHPTGWYIYADENMHVLSKVEHPYYGALYDPRDRSWYRSAIATGGLVRIPPYVFFSTNEVGMTLASAVPGGAAVVGCDINLETLHDALVAQRTSPGMMLVLANADGQLVASDQPTSLVTTSSGGKPKLIDARESGVPVLARLADMVRTAPATQSGERTVMHLGGETWYTVVSRLPIDGIDPLYLVSAVPESEAMGSAYRIRTLGIVATSGVILLSLLIAWLMAARMTKPLEQLGEQADAVRRFEFGPSDRVLSSVSEVRRLGTMLDEMRKTIRRLLDTVTTVAAEPEFGRLLSLLLTEILAEARADSGALYLTNDDNDVLMPAAALTRNRNYVADRLPSISLADAPELFRAATRDARAHTGVLSADDIARAGLDPLQRDKCHAAVISLLNRQRELVGVFVLLRSTPIEQEQLSFITTLTGLFVSAIEARELITAQRNLFDSFVCLIASAIDAKSPHTGDHCGRVPELAKMLANAACSATEGPYREFRLSEPQWQELHVAAWLHDCGKITTPEYVIEKATKLETIYDRIHEIRMRFEVLKCHEEIRYLKAVAAGADEATNAARRDERDENLRQIDDDFAFVASCNLGSEFMEPASMERLRRISELCWIRTIDDRIGVSRSERVRMDRTPPQPLPAQEKLLADKPEHRIERTGEDYAAKGNAWGFSMRAPELLYDRGELHNLLVTRGTLTAEERFKINEHIIHTIVMLSQLPFPKNMRNVPEIACGHHEKMDGTGYPKGLRGDQMSPLAKMMAIADIFEALTAADRPYKRGKTLSESLTIMKSMKNGGHIDPDLFDLFLRSGVYMNYALRYMAREQIDAVDIEDYLAQEDVAQA